MRRANWSTIRSRLQRWMLFTSAGVGTHRDIAGLVKTSLETVRLKVFIACFEILARKFNVYYFEKFVLVVLKTRINEDSANIFGFSYLFSKQRGALFIRNQRIV